MKPEFTPKSGNLKSPTVPKQQGEDMYLALSDGGNGLRALLKVIQGDTGRTKEGCLDFQS